MALLVCLNWREKIGPDHLHKGHRCDRAKTFYLDSWISID